MANEKIQNQAVSVNSLDAHIRAEQIRLVCKNIPAMWVSALFIPLALMYLWWNTVDRSMMISWAAFIYCVVLIQTGIYVVYKYLYTSIEQTLRLGKYLAFCSFATGTLWGAAGMYMSNPAMPEHFLLMSFIMAGFGSGSVVSSAMYLPACYMFLLPSMLPTIVTAFFVGSHLNNVIAIAITIFLIVLSVFANNLNKVFKESLRLRFENTDLVNELIVQKKELTTQRNELEIQKEIAERANAAKTRFLAAASHDLRQPLHAMGLFVSALSERVRGAVTRKLVLQLGASTEALRGLLNALLDISRLDAGVIQPRITPCSVQDLFDRLAHDYSAHALEKNISLRFVPTNYWVQCDATLLERIVRNLVSNAIRYTNNGGVRVGCRRCGEQLRIEVWDSGIGIAAHELDNIYHEFYQVGNPERDREKGLGLGLAIAHRLARLLNHRIDVKSVPGKGSVFALTLPRSNAIQTDREAPKSVAVGHLRAALVLVIDDELAIREATQIMLQDWGCEAVLADSAESALDVIAQTGRSPEVIIADYRLRNSKTGVEAIETLHAKYGRDIPAIVITGDTAPDRLREAEASGYHLLHKPLAPARLRALLSHVLSQCH